MQRVGGQMQTLGKKGMMYVTAPILGMGAASFKMANQFESSMSKVIGLVGVAEDQVSAWSDELLKLAPALGRTPQDLAEGMFFITSAGLRGAEALEVLTVSAKAASAGLGETATVADLVTSAVNAYGLENLTAAQATDILVASVREGKAEAPELASSLGQVLPIASEMGVAFNEVGAAVAAMTRTGTNAATASTQLKNIMVGLLKPTKQAEEALNDMGVSSKELREQIHDEGLLTVLMRLKDLTNEYGEEIMAQVFPNIRSLMGVLDLMGANMEENIEIFDRMTDTTGALDHAFETAAETGKFKWDATMAQMQASAITFGEAVQESAIPVLEDFAEWLNKVTDWFTNLSDEQQQNIIKWAGLTAAIFPVIFVLGTFINTGGAVLGMFGKIAAKLVTLAGAKTGFAAAGTAATVGFGAKLTALASTAGPIGVLVAALSGIIWWVNKVEKEWEQAGRTWTDVANERWVRGAEIARQGAQDIYDIEEEFFRNQQILAAETGKELAETMEEQRGLMNQEHDKWLTDRLEDLRVAFEDEGTLSETMYIKLRQQAFEHYVDMGKLTNEELYKIYLEYEDLFHDLGVVINRETGDILEDYGTFAGGMRGINLEMIDDARRTGTAMGQGLAHNMGIELDRMLADIGRKVNAWLRKIANLDHLTSTADMPSGVAPPTGWAGMFDSGGIVPGPIGEPQLAVVHGGETILPTHKSDYQNMEREPITAVDSNLDYGHSEALPDGKLWVTLMNSQTLKQLSRELEVVKYSEQQRRGGGF